MRSTIIHTKSVKLSSISYTCNIPVSLSTEMFLKMEGSDDEMVRDIFRQSLNGSRDSSPLPRVMAPLTCSGMERVVPMAASTRDGRKDMSEGDTTNTYQLWETSFTFTINDNISSFKQNICGK